MEYKFSDKIAALKPSAVREILKSTADPEVIALAAGNPAPEAFPVDDIKRIAADRDEAKAALSSKDRQFQAAMESKDRQIKAAKESGEQSLSECKAYLNGRIHELEDRIKELEELK